MDHDTVGVATIIVGLVLVIGAVRGTWRRIFQDVVLGQSTGTSSSAGSTTSPAAGTYPNEPFIPPPLQPATPQSYITELVPMTNGAQPLPTVLAWMELAALAQLITSVATLIAVLTALLQTLRTRRTVDETHTKLHQVDRQINGRMDQLLHETEKRALLEGATASDVMDDDQPE